MKGEKMDELIGKLEAEKAEYNRKMDEKISEMKGKRQLEISASGWKHLERIHVDPMQFWKLVEKATKEQAQLAMKALDVSDDKEEITKNETVTT